MYIAICDDDAHELKRVAGIVEKYAQTAGWGIRIQLFSDAETMLKSVEKERFSHYLLDVMMPCTDGISAAKEIRAFDTEAKIVFLTSFKEYAYESYAVKAYDYLLKPVEEARLCSLLNQFRMQEENAEACIHVQNGRGIFRIPFSQLSYLEVYQKKLYFHMTDGTVRIIAGNLAEYEKELIARKDFIKIHRSYIVNLKQITTLSSEGCTLISGKQIPISRLLYHQVREDYMAYLFGDAEV